MLHFKIYLLQYFYNHEKEIAMKLVIEQIGKAIASATVTALSILGVIVQSVIETLVKNSFIFIEKLAEEISASTILVFSSAKTVLLCFIFFWIGFFGLHKLSSAK